MRKRFVAILLEFILIAVGIRVKIIMNLTVIEAANLVIILSLIGMAALYYREIVGWFTTKIIISEETKTNILGQLFIVLMFGFALWLLFLVVRVIKYAWQLPL